MTTESTIKRAAALHERAVVCDMTLPHCPATPNAGSDFEACSSRLLSAGYTFASLTASIDQPSIESTIKWIAAARRYFDEHVDRYVFAETAEDILRAKKKKKLAVNFGFQGSNALLGDSNLVELYCKLGVRTMILAYNKRNFAGDGSHEKLNSGLSQFGFELIEEMNRVGMLIDVSHTGYKTSLDAMEASKDPVIFSHSNPRALYDHERNIPDELIRACADQGGVMGVNGVGIFMSEKGDDVSPEMLVSQIDYYVQIVGSSHVGIGLDFIYDLEYLKNFTRQNTRLFKVGGYINHSTYHFSPPEALPKITELLLDLGYSEEDIIKILGGNWLRVMKQVWK